jgi:LPS sulfotransferase NodH
MSGPKLSYVVCTAPRTGSSLLCAALAGTGAAGRPAEYFDVHPHNEQYWRKRLAIRDDAEYFGRVLAAGTTANGVFGFKLHWHQTPALMAKLSAASDNTELKATAPAGMDEKLRRCLGETRYIWLRRKNSVAQAISYYRASKTDIWRSPAHGPQPPAPAQPVAFDFDAIDKLVDDVERFDRSWYGFFMQHRLRALIVIYEDFIGAYETTIRGALAYLGLTDQRLVIAAPQYLQQADAISAEWERRYRNRRAEKAPPPRTAPGRVRRRPPPPSVAASELALTAYDLGSGINLAIEPASPGRAWMDASPKRFAYRCLPLVIANQSGWIIRNSHRLTATWDGTPGTEGVRVSYQQPCNNHYAASHFGFGVLTFSVGYLFRTPPGYNLHVRGPANWPKDGICALEGMVETDWSTATFTMNWKFTRPEHPVTFDAGEPIAMISPVPRGDIERFRGEIRLAADDPDWHASYLAWSRLRLSFNAALKAGQPEAVAAGWQRHYLRGVGVDGRPAPEHQTSLSLGDFIDRRSAQRRHGATIRLHHATAATTQKPDVAS